MEVKSETPGIAPAQEGALKIVQQNPVNAGSSELMEACATLNTYQRPTEDQARRHGLIGEAAAQFLYAVVTLSPKGPERSTAISRIREARAWANAAIALEGK
jgi:hypothetical protein